MNDIAPATLQHPKQPDLAEVKQQLEIEKLKLEMKFIRRNHYAQLLNTAAIMFVGLVVFYFFQRPQIEQTERHEVYKLAMSALELENEQDKKTMLDALNSMYPQNEHIATLARSQTVLTQVAAVPSTPPPAPAPAPAIAVAPPPVSNAAVRVKIEMLGAEIEQRTNECLELEKHSRDLERTFRELEVSMAKEEAAGGDQTRKPGRGPMYNSLYKQAMAIRAEFRARREQAAHACRLVQSMKEERATLIERAN
ncbi:MAG: hypothetical protein QOJ84_3805 [Bradyrhizobium sp.]|jgi:hypothetical protein|nr:hypothetical protein [Bradyrhizobium sp.]